MAELGQHTSCNLQKFLCFSIPSDNHFLNTDSEALGWVLRAQLCRRHSFCSLTRLLGRERANRLFNSE